MGDPEVQSAPLRQRPNFRAAQPAWRQPSRQAGFAWVPHHSGVEPYPEDSDRKHGLTKAAEMGISFVPVAGSALQVAFNEAAGRRLAERRTAWLNRLAAEVHALEDQIGDLAKLMDEDAFMDALTTASQIADRTSRAEKLQALRNAVVNSVMPNAPSLDAQQLLFDMIDRLTPTQLRMLKLLSDAPAWFDRHGLPLPDVNTTMPVEMIEAGMPELAGRRDLIHRFMMGLSSAVLIYPSVRPTESRPGWTRPTTNLGEELLAFIADPESEGGAILGSGRDP